MSGNYPVTAEDLPSPDSSKDGLSHPIVSDPFDVTAAKAAAGSLENSENQFRDLVEGSGLGLCIDKDWNLLYANQALANLFGYASADEILALESLGSIVAAEDQEGLWSYKLARRNGQDAPELYEARCVRRDGSPIWVEFRVNRIQWRGIEATQSVIVDISERKNTENALREENAHFKNALNKMSQGFCIFDGKQHLIFANERYAEVYGVSTELLKPGTTFRQILEQRIANGVYAGDSPEKYFQERCSTVVEDVDSTKIQTLSDGRIIAISRRPMSGGGWVATHDDNTELRDAETALREREELFSRAFRASPAACAISSPEKGHHYDVNQGWTELLGYTRQEALDNDAVSLGIWANPDERVHFVDLLKQRGSAKAFETKFRRKDGTIIDVLVSGEHVEFQDEPRLFVVYDDITQRKQAEAALRASEELFSKAFHNNPAACAIAAPKDGYHYDVNQGWMELLGYTREEALANSALTLGIWADANERARFVGLLKKNGSFKEFEAKFCRKDGTIIDVLVSGVYVEFQGEPRLLNIYDDITRRKQAEKLAANQASSMGLMKSIAFAANQSTNPNDSLSFCLKQICNYTGWDVGHVYMPVKGNSSTLSSAKCWFLSDDEKFQSFKETTEKYPCKPEEEEICRLALEQGKARWTRDVTSSIGSWRREAARESGLKEGVAFPIKIRETVVAVLEFYAKQPMEPTGSLVDILTEVGTQIGRVVERANTEAELVAHQDHLEELVDKRTAQVKHQTRKLELALAKEKDLNALQRQFVAMASHEFRTPLTIIDSVAQRLQRRSDKLQPSDIVQRTQKIRDAVKRMITLIESMLSSASLDAGKLKAETAPYNLRALVEQSCAQQREISPMHNIVSKLDDLPTDMIGDPNLLERVFVNLLSNAVKYSPDNPQVLVVGQTQGDSVYVAVKDHGLGIPEDELPKLFERFFRASTSSGIAGTGIGLNLVSQILELHDGRIDIKSTVGEGSTFIVKLPIRNRYTATEQPNGSGQLPDTAPRLDTAS